MDSHRFCARPLLIAPSYTGALQDLRRAGAKSPGAALDVLAVYGVQSSGGKPFLYSDGLAIIPIHGVLLNRYSYSDSWATGYNFVRRQVGAAMADPEVKAVLFDVESFGGQAQGCFECADALYAFRGVKPMAAIVDANCYSAAYALSSAADRIYVTPSGGVGSIGVVMMHVDESKLDEDFGLKITLIYAGQHKVDGNPFEPLPDSVRVSFQRQVNETYESFVDQVARNRGLDAKAVRATEAACFSADEAQKLGLVDEIMEPIGALADFTSSLTTQVFMGADMGEKTTDITTTGATPVTEAATAVAAERARIDGILTSEPAQGRADLASYLALKTDLSVEVALGVLAASPKVGATSSLDKAMEATLNPEVGAGDGGDSESMVEAKAILSAYHQATGFKLDGGK